MLSESQRAVILEAAERHDELTASPTSAAELDADTNVDWLKENWENFASRAFAELDADTNVDWLKENWENFASRAFEESLNAFKDLDAKWSDRERDPIFWPVDLLSPIDCEAHEPTHTLVLAHLLSPHSSPPSCRLGYRFIKELLRGHADVPEVDFNKISVEAERTICLPAGAGRQRRRPRIDIWIEIPTPKSWIIAVIENKIGSDEGDGQLKDYKSAIDQRSKEIKSSKAPLCFFLTPKGEKPKAPSWKPLSYLDVAGALRRSLREPCELHDKCNPHHTYASLYLSTILHHVIGLPHTMPSKTDYADYTRLVKYLREFIEQ